jgi:hypothetical protein
MLWLRSAQGPARDDRQTERGPALSEVEVMRPITLLSGHFTLKTNTFTKINIQISFLTQNDLRFTIKSYIISNGKTCPKFQVQKSYHLHSATLKLTNKPPF